MRTPFAMRLYGIVLCGALMATGHNIPAQAEVGVTTYHNDNFRTGWNANETTLTQSNVAGGSFKLLQTVTLDEQVDAQPLVVPNVVINGQQYTVVYVATENNSVYAIDTATGQVLLKSNLGTPVYYTNLPGQCSNNGPNVGISSTPVIDPSSGLLYLVAYTWESNAPVYRIHALSITTLKDAVTPVEIAASGTLSNGRAYNFNPMVSRQRAALLLANGTVYAGFASFCDMDASKSRGWVLGWQAGTLGPIASNELTNKRAHSTNNYFLTPIWMSGYGLAANPAGSVYFVTGNSDYSGDSYNKVTNIAESAAQMSSDLSTLLSLFTPSDHASLDMSDTDFGAGGLMLLPPQPGLHPDIAVAAGKDGNMYMLDADALGKEWGVYAIGKCWCGPSYFQGSDGHGRVVTSGGYHVEVWTVKGKRRPKLMEQYEANGIPGGQAPGFFTSVSSNGTASGSAVIWAVGRPQSTNDTGINLYAYNADTGQLLFQAVAGQWPNLDGDSNTVPVVANGRVYVASDEMLSIFGLGTGKGASFPKIRVADMLVPLAPGRHEIYAVLRSRNGARILATRRNGEVQRIDATKAMRADQFAVPSPGHALIVRGTYTQAGVLEADTLLHAKDNKALWPADR